MDILVVGRNGVDGVGTYINDFVNMAADAGHDVWFHGINPFIQFGGFIHDERTIVAGKYNVAYLNYFQIFPDIDCRKVYHVHLAEIKSGFKDNITDVISNDSNFKIAVNSDYQKQQLMAMKVQSNQIHIMNNYVDETVFVSGSAEKIPNSILLMCNIRENNRPVWQPLVRAMRQLPEYRLNILGNISERLQPKVKEFLNQARNSNIQYAGKIVDPVLKAEFISRHEIAIGVGRSAKEMVLCGLPVLTYREGFAGYIGAVNIDKLEKDNFTTRWYVEESENDKVTKIVQAIRNPETYDNTTAIQRFGMRSNLAKYVDLLGG